jgi:hypothetical protein
MNIFFKYSLVFLICFSSISFANDLSSSLQKTCTAEQVRQHKNIKDQKLESTAFQSYCKCESEFVIQNATNEQIDQIPSLKNKYPSWLKRLKSDAFKSCVEQKQQTTTQLNNKANAFL